MTDLYDETRLFSVPSLFR